MNEYTEKEFLDWFKAQPPEREVRMERGYITDGCCGCALGEFLKDKGFTSGRISTEGILTQDRETVARVNLRQVYKYGPDIFSYFGTESEEEIDAWNEDSFGGLQRCLKQF